MVRFLLAIILFTILAFFCIQKHASQIEENLTLQTQHALDQSGHQFVQVNFDGRDLLLTGESPDAELKDRAEEIALEIPGVRTVNNLITIVELIESIDDTDHSFEVAPAPLEEIAASYETIMTLSDGKVLLQGQVNNESTRVWLAHRAKELFGVDNVTDQLVLAQGAPDDWQDSAELALLNLNLLEQGKATLRNTILVLSGTVASDDIAEQVKSQINTEISQNYQAAFELSQSEKKSMSDHAFEPLNVEPATIFPAIPKPYLTEIIYENNRIHLKGHIADESARVYLKSLADSIVGTENVNEEFVAVYGFPQGWHKSIETVLLNIEQLENAQVKLINSDITLIGHAASGEVRQQVKAAIAAGLVEFEVSYGITAPDSDAPDSCKEYVNNLLKGQNILFDEDKADLDGAGRELLNSLAEGMRDCPRINIEVLGYTDDKGSYKHNLRLSERRANAVIDYLIYAGIQADRLSAKGLSEKDPIAKNDDSEGLSKNRRIEFRIQGG